MAKVRIFSAYDPPVGEVVDCVGAGEDGRSLTWQSEADACDINKIIARFDAGGLITHVNQAQPMYVDVSQVGDYRGALDQVKAVEAFFMGFPASIRATFDNDPAVFLDFMSDPANEDEARRRGLLPPKVVPPPNDTPVVVPPVS